MTIFSKSIDRFLFALVALYFILWSLFIPVFEASDEQGYYQGLHWSYTKSPLVDYRQLDPRESKEFGVVAHGPFYYMVMLPVVSVMQIPSSTKDVVINYNMERLTRFRKGVYNSFHHRPQERVFDWNLLEQRVHQIRLISMIWGLLTVFVVYKFVQKLSRKESLLPTASMVFVGLNPMFAHIFTAITHMHLFIFLFALFLYMLCWSKLNKSTYWWLGIIAGLASMTKTTGLILLPIGAIGLSIRQARITVKEGFIVGIGFLISSGWYWTRNLIMYGQILPFDEIFRVTGSRSNYKYVLGVNNYILDFFRMQFKTFFSGFGYQSIYFAPVIEWILLFLMLLGVWGTLGYVRKMKGKGKKIWGIISLSLAVYILGLFIAHIKFPAFHAKDMYPMMTLIAAVVLTGLSNLNIHSLKKAVLSLGLIVWFAVARDEFVQLWNKNGMDSGLVYKGVAMVLAVTVVLKVLNWLIKKWGKTINQFIQNNKKALLIIAFLLVFCLNVGFLITTITPTLFGDNNLTVEQWQRVNAQY